MREEWRRMGRLAGLVGAILLVAVVAVGGGGSGRVGEVMGQVGEKEEIVRETGNVLEGLGKVNKSVEVGEEVEGLLACPGREGGGWVGCGGKDRCVSRDQVGASALHSALHILTHF